MSASQRPTIGIVGTGENARDHAAACRALSADLVAICDISAEALERFGIEFDCANRYQSLESLLDAHHLDVLIISTWVRTTPRSPFRRWTAVGSVRSWWRNRWR